MAAVGTSTQHKDRGLVRIDIAITTAADGSTALAVVGQAWGRLVGVAYDAGDLDTGTDITISDTKTGATVFSLTNAGTLDRFFRPTQVITTNAGVAVTAATTATNVDRDIYLAGKISCVVAQGGNAKSGTLSLIVDESIGGGL